MIEVVVYVIAVVTEAYSDEFSVVDARSGFFTAGVAKYFSTEPTVVSSINYGENLVAVVAVSSLAIRHPFCLARWGNSFCDLILELAHFLNERLTF